MYIETAESRVQRNSSNQHQDNAMPPPSLPGPPLLRQKNVEQYSASHQSPAISELNDSSFSNIEAPELRGPRDSKKQHPYSEDVPPPPLSPPRYVESYFSPGQSPSQRSPNVSPITSILNIGSLEPQDGCDTSNPRPHEPLHPPKLPPPTPIKFEDVMGRKFSFPYHLCCTWSVSQ